MFFFCIPVATGPLPSELEGNWESETIKITVRTRTAEKEWVFTSDSAKISIRIHNDFSVTGTIGTASFDQGRIKKNRGNPDVTGLSEIIDCGSIGKIFENDPLESKEVQLWLAPMKDGVIDTELRFPTGWNQFPMTGMLLRKVSD